jgi:hypothetical protein
MIWILTSGENPGSELKYYLTKSELQKKTCVTLTAVVTHFNQNAALQHVASGFLLVEKAAC